MYFWSRLVAMPKARKVISNDEKNSFFVPPPPPAHLLACPRAAPPARPFYRSSIVGWSTFCSENVKRM